MDESHQAKNKTTIETNGYISKTLRKVFQNRAATAISRSDLMMIIIFVGALSA